jgi:hypothetical protein
MSLFKIQNISDKSIIEIIAMNIDNENNILAKEGDIAFLISIIDFKDMMLGTSPNSENTNVKIKEATYKLFSENNQTN